MLNMSTVAIPECVYIKQEIKQEIDYKGQYEVDSTDNIIKIDSAKNESFYPETSVNGSNVCSIKSKLEQDSDVIFSEEVDPLAVGPNEDVKSCTQSEDSDKQVTTEEETASKKKIVKCHVCNKKIRANFVRHLRTHTGEKPYECTVCKKKFARDSHLATHARVHTREQPYKCSVCHKNFAHSSAVSRHLRIHTGEKPYKCTVCENKFSDSSQLSKHLHIHTGTDAISKKCPICKKILRFASFAVHLRNHTEGKPFECNVCKKTFSQPSSLARHSRTTHTG